MYVIIKKEVIYSHHLSLSTLTLSQFSDTGGGTSSLVPASDPSVNLSHHIRWRHAFAYLTTENIVQTHVKVKVKKFERVVQFS